MSIYVLLEVVNVEKVTYLDLAPVMNKIGGGRGYGKGVIHHTQGSSGTLAYPVLCVTINSPAPRIAWGPRFKMGAVMT